MYPSSDQQLNYETDDAVFFFTTAYEPLNAWSAHAVKLWGKRFPTMEHAYHYRKFSDEHPAVAEAIRKAPSPWAAMQIESKNEAKQRADWNDIKVEVMNEVLRAKAAQNEDVRERLLATGNKRIVKNAPWDSFWGCGKDGKGQNVMGQIWMDIREELRADAKQAH